MIKAKLMLKFQVNNKNYFVLWPLCIMGACFRPINCHSSNFTHSLVTMLLCMLHVLYKYSSNRALLIFLYLRNMSTFAVHFRSMKVSKYLHRGKLGQLSPRNWLVNHMDQYQPHHID